jgi:hypothetical protein
LGAPGCPAQHLEGLGAAQVGLGAQDADHLTDDLPGGDRGAELLLLTGGVDDDRPRDDSRMASILVLGPERPGFGGVEVHPAECLVRGRVQGEPAGGHALDTEPC